MNFSSSINSNNKQKYSKLSSTYIQNDGNIGLDSPRAAKSAFPSLNASQQSQRSNIEIEFMMVEDGLSRHRNYILKNLSRIPYFSSSEKAEKELRRLCEQLSQMKDMGEPLEQPNIENRLSEIRKQHKNISEEEERIAKLRSMTDDAKAREDAEYNSVLKQIEDAKRELNSLEMQISQYHENSRTSRDKLDKAKKNLQSHQKSIDQKQKEEDRLLKLQKQSRQELKNLQTELNAKLNEEIKISQIEHEIEKNSEEYKKLSKVLDDKKQQVLEKTQKIQKLLRESEELETNLDEAVNYAGTVTQQKSHEAYMVSDSDSNLEQNFRSMSINSSSTKNQSMTRPSIKPAPIDIPSDDDVMKANQNPEGFENLNLSESDGNLNNVSYNSSFRSNSQEQNQYNNSSNNSSFKSNRKDFYKSNDLYNHQSFNPNTQDQPSNYSNNSSFMLNNQDQDQLNISYGNSSFRSNNNNNNNNQYEPNDLYDHQSFHLDENEPIQYNDNYNNSSFKASSQKQNEYEEFTNQQSFRSSIHSQSKSSNYSHHSSLELQTHNPDKLSNFADAHFSDEYNHSDYQEDEPNNSNFNNLPNNYLIEEEEEDMYDHQSDNTKTRIDPSALFKNNDSLSFNRASVLNDSDDDLNDFKNDKNFNINYNDDDDDDEDDEEVKALLAKNSLRHSSQSSNSNMSNVTNAAFKAIGMNLYDQSPVVKKYENETASLLKK